MPRGISPVLHTTVSDGLKRVVNQRIIEINPTRPTLPACIKGTCIYTLVTNVLDPVAVENIIIRTTDTTIIWPPGWLADPARGADGSVPSTKKRGVREMHDTVVGENVADTCPGYCWMVRSKPAGRVVNISV